MAYRIVRFLARLLLGLFYRRIEVVGGEHIPHSGPLIIAANHHNALVDPMLVMAAIPRSLTILAAAPLFRNPVMGPLLRLVGALPVLRRQEGIADRGRNDRTFDAVATALRRGGAVLLFPEGRTQPEPQLLPLRTGAARMLLDAVTGDAPVTLLPVGLIFHDPGTFRTGWALVLVGRPVPTADCVAIHEAEPERAVRELTARLGQALREQIIEADDRQTLRLMRVVETLWRGRPPASPSEDTARALGVQQVARAYHRLHGRVPERLAALRRRVEAYSQQMELAGLTDGDLQGSPAPGAVLRWIAREGSSLLLPLPLALAGMAIHAAPYLLTAGVVRGLRRPPEEEATYKILAGTLFYPLCWIAEGVLAWALGGRWAVIALVAALLPTGFFALAWQERLGRAAREARAFVRLLLDRDLRRHLLARRAALVSDLAALAALADALESPNRPGQS